MIDNNQTLQSLGCPAIAQSEADHCAVLFKLVLLQLDKEPFPFVA